MWHLMCVQLLVKRAGPCTGSVLRFSSSNCTFKCAFAHKHNGSRLYMCMYMVTGLTNVLPENAPETEVPNIHHWAGQTGASLEASIMPPVSWLATWGGIFKGSPLENYYGIYKRHTILARTCTCTYIVHTCTCAYMYILYTLFISFEHKPAL